MQFCIIFDTCLLEFCFAGDQSILSPNVPPAADSMYDYEVQLIGFGEILACNALSSTDSLT